jgi:hypothetical protein
MRTSQEGSYNALHHVVYPIPTGLNMPRGIHICTDSTLYHDSKINGFIALAKAFDGPRSVGDEAGSAGEC